MAGSWGSEWKWGSWHTVPGPEEGQTKKPYRKTSGPQHRPLLTSRNSHTFHQSHIWFPQFIRPRPPASTSQRPCSGSGLTQAQSFLGEAQLGSPVPPKTDSIHSWPLQPPLRPGGPTELKAPSLPIALFCYLACQVKACQSQLTMPLP